MGKRKQRYVILPEDKLQIDKIIKTSIDKYGAICRLPVWNNVVYALDPSKGSIVPVQQYSRQEEFKNVIDFARLSLENRINGSWLYSPKYKDWLHVPLSFIERMQIAEYDLTAIDNIPMDCPISFAFPV